MIIETISEDTFWNKIVTAVVVVVVVSEDVIEKKPATIELVRTHFGIKII